MTQNNRFFDDLGKLINDAAAVGDGVRREVETAIKGQMERVVNDLDLVKRDDYDALRELVITQSEEIAALRLEIDALKNAR